MHKRLTVEECVKILTSGVVGFSRSEIELACLALLDYVRELASPLRVEKESSLLGFSMAFSPEKNAIIVNPVLLAFILRDIHCSTKVPFTDLLWYLVSHEKGHYELIQKGLKPLKPKEPYYMILYARFQDYAITKFLRKRDEKYVEIEQVVLRAEIERISGGAGMSLNDLAVLGLAIALNYVKIEDLVLTPRQIEGAKIISDKMKTLKTIHDIPQQTDQCVESLTSHGIISHGSLIR